MTLKNRSALGVAASARRAIRPTVTATSVVPIQRRWLQDVHITRTGKPIIRVAGGRSSLGGHTVTVFGATGFLGRYIVNRLARSGCTVVVPYREEMGKRHLKVTGDLGRVVFLEYDLRNTQSIEESVRHSDTVYNLVGRDYETKNFDFQDVHVEGSERIAEAAAKYDVDRFIHVSSYNANKASKSKYFSTKGWGEEVVRNIYPETTIVRPAPMFGWEDRLLNKYGSHVAIYASNHLRETAWPVHVIDVGAALEVMIYDDNTAGQTYELYGPNQYSMRQVYDVCVKEVLKRRPIINIPAFMRSPLVYVLHRLLWFTKTDPDAITREFIDQHIDPNAKTFRDLGIVPSDMKSAAYEYLQGMRSPWAHDLPPMTEREKREEKKFLHTIEN